MEAVGEFVPGQADRPGSAMPSRLPQLAAVPCDEGASVAASVAAALALLRASSASAVEDVARLNFFQVSDLAEDLEDLSRIGEYLQIIAAAGVDRTRREAATVEKASSGWGSDTTAATPGWLTGWKQEPGEGAAGAWGVAKPGDASDGVNGAGADDGTDPHGGRAAVPFGAGDAAVPAATVPAVTVPALSVSALAAATVADDGYRNSAEFLQARLRIGASEAKRRLALGAEILPRTGIAGRILPPARQELAAAVAEGTVASRTATLIAMSLDRVGHVATSESVDCMEHALTETAVENDPDFLARVARRWTDALDQDGAEPSEEVLRRLQGAFIRKPRHGLQHLEIFATADQFEQLVTVMNVATNPRLDAATGAGDAGDHVGAAAGGGDTGDRVSCAAGAGDAIDAGGLMSAADAARLDPRTIPQKRLDGLVGACKVALASGSLSAAGGLRPQIMATINYQDLVERLGASEPGASVFSGTTGTYNGGAAGSLLFSGPVAASTVRKIACDADIIPVLLGGEGRVLDIGRASRVFPPHIRKAITARDQGCSFPQCTMPAPWCEAHHVTYWSRGGSTGTDNGTLLCSHHHHLVHKEQWTIQMRRGIPWFIPPPHVDPAQAPLRNRYFRLE